MRYHYRFTIEKPAPEEVPLLALCHLQPGPSIPERHRAALAKAAAEAEERFVASLPEAT